VSDFDEIKKRASLPTKILPLCLAGEVMEEIDDLERQLAEAKPSENLEERSPKLVIAEQIAEAQERMREATVDFHLRAMGARTWSAFYAGQPERRDGESGTEWDERIYPWYAELVSRSCTDPVMSVEQVAELVDLINGRSWAELTNTCFLLNAGKVDIPNSDAASALIRSSEQT